MNNLDDGMGNGLPDWAIKVIIFAIIIITLLIFIAIDNSCDGMLVRTFIGLECIERIK